MNVLIRILISTFFVAIFYFREEQFNMDIKETDIATQSIYHGKVVDLNVNTIKLPNGKTAKREIVHHAGSCAAIVVNKQKELLLVEQWRDPIQQVSLEIPAGLIDANDISPQTAMKRELNEETGLEAEYWEKVSEFYTSPGFTDEKVHLFYCDTLTKLTHKKGLDADEFLNCKWFAPNKLKELLSQNKIVDGKTRYAISILDNMTKTKVSS